MESFKVSELCADNILSETVPPPNASATTLPRRGLQVGVWPGPAMWLGSCLSRHLPQQRAGEAGGQHKASGTLGGEGPRVQDLQAALPPLQQPSARDLPRAARDL